MSRKSRTHDAIGQTHRTPPLWIGMEHLKNKPLMCEGHLRGIGRKKLRSNGSLTKTPSLPSGMRYFLHPSPTVSCLQAKGFKNTTSIPQEIQTLCGLVQFLGPASTSRVARRKIKRSWLAPKPTRHSSNRAGRAWLLRRDAINLDIAPLDQVDIVANAENNGGLW